MRNGFEARQAHAARVVEARLAALLAGAASPATPDRLAEAMRHAVLGGGKRFRPFLVLETAALLGVPEPAAVEVAAALECIHCYSLVHDDLPAMDNDTLRRGRPTVWAAFDEWTAILAGDALLTLAFEIVCDPAAPVPQARRSELVCALARAAGREGMVGGQTLDLEADKLGVPARPDLAHVRRLQAMKTGALIVFAAEAGAILAGAPAAQRTALAIYGRQLGLAFQISDDLLDAEGHAATVGKAVGKDAAAGKATAISLGGVERARAELKAAVDAAIGALAGFDAGADALRHAARFMATRDR